MADSEAIFRVGMSKIFAVESDLEVVAQTETLSQTLNAVAATPADVILFETGMSPIPRTPLAKSPGAPFPKPNSYWSRSAPANRKPWITFAAGCVEFWFAPFPRSCWCAACARWPRVKPGSTSKE